MSEVFFAAPMVGRSGSLPRQEMGVMYRPPLTMPSEAPEKPQDTRPVWKRYYERHREEILQRKREAFHLANPDSPWGQGKWRRDTKRGAA